MPNETTGGAQWSESPGSGVGVRATLGKVVLVSAGVYEIVDATDPRPAAAALVSDGAGGYTIDDSTLVGVGVIAIVGETALIL
jgi:hypothetical protein